MLRFYAGFEINDNTGKLQTKYSQQIGSMLPFAKSLDLTMSCITDEQLYLLFWPVIVDLKSLLNAQVPSSLRTCKLCFQVRKLGVNFTRKFTRLFQWLNFVCKQMFIARFNN